MIYTTHFYETLPSSDETTHFFRLDGSENGYFWSFEMRLLLSVYKGDLLSDIFSLRNELIYTKNMQLQFSSIILSV